MVGAMGPAVEDRVAILFIGFNERGCIGIASCGGGEVGSVSLVGFIEIKLEVGPCLVCIISLIPISDILGEHSSFPENCNGMSDQGSI